MREKQREEAKRRMHMLDLMDDVHKGFEKDVIFYSERQNYAFNAILYFVSNNPEIEKKIKEWEMDRNDLRDGFPIAYVWNETGGFGEFGSIEIKPSMGGVTRLG